VCILHKIGTTIFHFCGTQKRDPKGVAGTLFTMFLPLNARTIKAPRRGGKAKNGHTPPITAMSEIDFLLTQNSVAQLHKELI
jgi:hypothetical protein